MMGRRNLLRTGQGGRLHFRKTENLRSDGSANWLDKDSTKQKFHCIAICFNFTLAHNFHLLKFAYHILILASTLDWYNAVT